MPNLLKLSRPRFWFYTAGPFAVGYLAATQHFPAFGDWRFVIGLLLWLIPANLLLYGVNDLSDYDTDQYNLKKQLHEGLLADTAIKDRRITMIVSLTSAIALLGWAAVQGWTVFAISLTFVALGIAYSTEPFRFKRRAFLDSYSNILYVVPGVVGYVLALSIQDVIFQPSWEFWLAVAAGTAYSVAMHAFSAIPDIIPDQKAGIKTIAVTLGHRGTLWWCVAHWSIMTLIATAILGLGGLLGIAYIAFPIWLLVQPKVDITPVYWLFPYLNLMVGACLFWWILIEKIL